MERKQRLSCTALGASTSSVMGLLVGLTAVTLLLLPRVQAGSSGSDKCTSASSFFCPNCGGYEVSDCVDCDGFRSSDTLHEICFDRRLFQARNVDETDHEDYYRFLWHDLAGTIVWFLTAGVATACGVGGGGIYVPLGTLLLQFAPKQASGLSQASIFGASLGGILLNMRCRHPVTKIRHDPAPEAKEERQLGHQTELTQSQESAYTAMGNKFYTRPLINFDMALFLAPMEMAGAVLGVLIQKILPNWLYLLLASIVLGLTAKKTFSKYQSTAAKEKAARDSASLPSEEKEKAEAVEAAPSLNPVAGDLGTQHDSNNTVSERHALARRKQYLEEDMRQYPKEKFQD